MDDPSKHAPREKTEREVRAGPGDAGRQDRPEPLPRPPGDRKRGRQASRLFAGLVILGLIVWGLLALAA